jgi:hypothetical protein
MKRSWGFLIPKYYYQYGFKNFYATVIQRAYRNYKKRAESSAKRVWEAVRNDGTPDRKKFLGILMISQMKINPETQEEYALRLDEFVDMLKKANAYQYYIENYNLAKWATAYEEYINYYPSLWIEKKKSQLNDRLDKEAHDLVKEILEQKGYRQAYISRWGLKILYLPWRYMIESLQDPENYLIKKINGYFVKIK